MLFYVYADCSIFYCYAGIVMLSAVMLSRFVECHYDESRF
jgi:hypothetical protein